MGAATAVVRGVAATRSKAPSYTPAGMTTPRGRGALKRTPTIHFVASKRTKVSLFVQRALSNFYFQGLTFCIVIAILFYKSMLLCSQQEFLSSITDRYIAKISYRKSPAKLKHKSN